VRAGDCLRAGVDGGAVMSRAGNSPVNRHAQACRRYELAQEACVHWDYECGIPSGGCDCCHELIDAERAYLAARTALDVAEHA
jgi:hypothetical protein